MTLDVIIGVIFFIYCIVIAFRALKGRIARIKQRFKKLCGLDGIKKPNFLGKTIQKLLPEKPNNGKDLIVLNKEKPLDTESDPLRKETETDDQILRIGKLHPRSSSSDYPEDSTSNLDLLRLRSMKSIETDVKLFSARGTETDLLNSYRASVSPRRRRSIRLPSHILDLDGDGLHTRTGSMPEFTPKGDLGLDVVMEEAQTATLKKEMLKDDRFKDLDQVQVDEQNSQAFYDEERGTEDKVREQGESGLKKPVAKFREMFKDDRFKDIDKVQMNEQNSQAFDDEEIGTEEKESNNPVAKFREMFKDERFKDLDKVEIKFEDEEDKGVMRKITMFTDNDHEEMMPLSPLKDEDWRNSLDTNSLDMKINKEEEGETRSPNVKNETSSRSSRHEVMSLSAIDPDQSQANDDVEALNQEEKLRTEDESSESPEDIMTLSGVMGKDENEPHSAA